MEAVGLNREEDVLILNEWAAILKPVVPHFQWRSRLSDPDDEHVFEVVIDGFADDLNEDVATLKKLGRL